MEVLLLDSTKSIIYQKSLISVLSGMDSLWVLVTLVCLNDYNHKGSGGITRS